MPHHTPEALLERARGAGTPGLRAKYATRGLSRPKLERDTQALLLRQLYLSHLERGRYQDARDVAEQMVSTGLLGDVALHDASRACLCLDDLVGAARHLRAASRSGPPSRRAFHLSCLASLYFHTGRASSAVLALRRALRWASEERPLYQAQLSLAALRSGEATDLRAAYDALSATRRRGGYADYVLGDLARELGKTQVARKRLLAFITQVEAASVSVRAGLRLEFERAKDLLRRLSDPES